MRQPRVGIETKRGGMNIPPERFNDKSVFGLPRVIGKIIFVGCPKQVVVMLARQRRRHTSDRSVREWVGGPATCCHCNCPL